MSIEQRLSGTPAGAQEPERIAADDETRCALCGWPLADNTSKGCVRGNCSMRPLPERAYSPTRARREYQGHLGDRYACQVVAADLLTTQAERIAALEKELAYWQAAIRCWVAENGPGGWIDELRRKVTAKAERIAQLKAARDEWHEAFEDMKAAAFDLWGQAEAAESKLAQATLKMMMIQVWRESRSHYMGGYQAALSDVLYLFEPETDGNRACGGCGHLSSQHGLDRGGESWEGCYLCECSSYSMRAALSASPHEDRTRRTEP